MSLNSDKTHYNLE